MIAHGKDIKIFSGTSNRPLAEAICKEVGTELGNAEVGAFSDGENFVSIYETVRGSDVFVVQSTSSPVNDNLMELLIMIDALKRASAGRITAVMPYFGYARQDRKTKPRDPISAKLVANLITRARAFAQKLGMGLAIVDKRRQKANSSEVMNIIGDVRGKKVILFDDMVDTAGSLCGAAQALVELGGAVDVIACASHGVLSGPAVERIEKSVLKEVYFLDTVPPKAGVACDKIKYLSVAHMFAEAIERIYEEVVGLGNPGEKYENTRHNVGFLTVDELAERARVPVQKLKHRALTNTLEVGGVKVLLMKPVTYMNLSGEAVGEAARFYKLPPERVLVISDDVSLPLGKLRIRKGGSAGGHNGLKSIIQHLGTDQFPRIKVGVGQKPHPDYDMADWVLSKFAGEDLKTITEAIRKAADAVECLIQEGPDKAMNRFNG